MRKGNVTIFIVLGVVILLGIILYSQSKSSSSSTVQESSEQATVSEEGKKESGSTSGYKGAILAGSTSPYLEFMEEDYEKAVKDGKIIILNFYANWCPICRGEAPQLYTGFNQLTTDKVVGFRVNYKDDQTDDHEKKLAEQYEVTYQHTKVIVKDGKQILKSGDVWDTETFIKEVSGFL
jgi:thiol-disulfide isomerase/thioredoxin